MLTLSDPEFHKRIMDKHRVGKRRYIVFPALVYNQIPRWLITFQSKMYVTVRTLRQMFQDIVHKPVPGASTFKDKRDYVKEIRPSVSFPKDLFRWIPDATKETSPIFGSNIMGLPSMKAIPGTLKATNLLNINYFLRQVFNRDSQNEGIKSGAEGTKKIFVKNVHSRWNNTLFIPSINVTGVNRNHQLSPLHEYGPSALNPMHTLRIKETQSPAVGKNILNSSNIMGRNTSEHSRKLYFYYSPDIEALIEQKLMEIKRNMVLTKETIMTQSATIYYQIEQDLKRQFNMDMISEKVYRQIDRRLKIECERRGIL